MAKPKGLPKSGGRRKGSVNKVTKALQDHALKLVDDNATPLDVMLQIMRDAPTMELRLIAASKAAPYLHRQLKSVEQSGEGGGAVKVEIGWMMPGIAPPEDK